jgi:hypothetical protein
LTPKDAVELIFSPSLSARCSRQVSFVTLRFRIEYAGEHAKTTSLLNNWGHESVGLSSVPMPGSYAHFACVSSVRWQKRSMDSRMASADFVQRNGLGAAFLILI